MSENSEVAYSNLSKEMQNDEHTKRRKNEGSDNQTDSQKDGYF